MGPEAIERFQGIGPSTDAEKQDVEEIRENERNRTRTDSLASGSLQDQESDESLILRDRSETDDKRSSSPVSPKNVIMTRPKLASHKRNK